MAVFAGKAGSPEPEKQLLMSRPFQQYQKEIEFALESVSLAARAVKTVRARMVESAFTKPDESPVTVADFAAQAIVAKKLIEVFPKDPLVGEESASELRLESTQKTIQIIGHFLEPFTGKQTSETICDWIDHGSQEPSKRFWTLDPIDGTKGFIRGDQYAVALALIEEGDPKVAVMACPNLEDGKRPVLGGKGTLVCAVRGEGTWVNDLDGTGAWKPLKVSNRAQGKDAVMLRSFEKKHVDSPRMTRLISRLGICHEPILMDSLAKYVVLASGEADLLLRFPMEDHPYEWIWDQASGVLVIEEAGGLVSDLDGKPLDFSQGRQLKTNRGVLLSNALLHPAALSALRELREKI